MSTESSFDEDAKWSIVLSKRPVAQDPTLTLRESRNALRGKRTQRDALLQQIEQARAQGSPLPQPQENELWTQIVRLEQDMDELDTQVRTTGALARHKKRAVQQAIRDIIMQRLATTILPHVWEAVAGAEGLNRRVGAVFVDAQNIYILHERISNTFDRFTKLDKSDSSILGRVSVGTGNTTVPRGLYVDNDYVYIAHNNGKYLTVLNKSDLSVVPNTPQIHERANAVFADDMYVYVGHHWGGSLTVITKGNTDGSGWSVVPDTPQLPRNGHAFGVYADDKFVYAVHNRSGHFRVITKGEPNGTGWSFVSVPSLSGHGRGVYVDDDYVYTTHEGGNRFTVITKGQEDGTGWSAVSGTPLIPGASMNIYVDNRFVYFAHSGGNGLTIVDKTDWSVVPDTPSLPGTGYSVFVTSQTLYVGHDEAPYLTAVSLPPPPEP